MGILSWPDHLRAAGIKVAEHNNWRSNRPLGNLPDRPFMVWHHDGSPAGASPGALDWITNAYNSQDASAQIWVGYDGTWHFVGSGIAWHTGAVLPGMPNNYNAVGVETDETTGETWSPALLDSLRRGTAAIAAAEGYDPGSWLHFHKTICSPPGRKSDPSGLDLAAERATVRALMSGKNPVQPTPAPVDPNTPAPGGADPKEDEDMALRVVRKDGCDYAYSTTTGVFFAVRDPDHYLFLTAGGFITTPHGQAPSVDGNLLEFIRGECARAAGQHPNLARVEGFAGK